jgi:hypothetical protein
MAWLALMKRTVSLMYQNESSTTEKIGPEHLESSLERPKTYWEESKPFNGFITRQNPLILLARPFACFLYPAVFWGFTVGGLWSSWVRSNKSYK